MTLTEFEALAAAAIAIAVGMAAAGAVEGGAAKIAFGFGQIALRAVGWH